MTATPAHLVELSSPWSFEPTVARIRQAIQDAGLLLIAQIDHAAGAEAAGLTLPPMLVIVYGHPKGGTPVMQVAPAAGLDLPLRVLVRETSPGQAIVAFHPIVEMLGQSGVAPEMARPLEAAQNLIRQTLLG